MDKQEKNQWLKCFNLMEKGLEKEADIVLDGIIAKWYSNDTYEANSLKNLAHSI